VSRQAVYGCTALVGVNKKGILRPDADGYYTLVVGALNAFNSVGAYYPFETGKAIFESSSTLMRRIKTGCCKGEMGHPKPVPGQSNRDFIQRVLQIEETRVCCHFRKIWLEENGYKDSEGRDVVAILAEVGPSGPYGPALKASLENPHENVCFSIRSLTQDHMTPAGYLQKDLKTVVNFDWVVEAGMTAASRWNSPGLESLQELTFTSELLTTVETRSLELGVSAESSGLTDIRKALGWLKKEFVPPLKRQHFVRASANW
jgi:hypothetical protein